MKKSELRQLIKEEIQKILNEGSYSTKQEIFSLLSKYKNIRAGEQDPVDVDLYEKIVSLVRFL
jgi:hypothetical protein